LLVEASITPDEIDEVRIGQAATVHVHTSQGGAPVALAGIVRILSAARIMGADSTASFRTEIEVPPDQYLKITSYRLTAGMPAADVRIETGARCLTSSCRRWRGN
jgi:HlyD family secretion protein